MPSYKGENGWLKITVVPWTHCRNLIHATCDKCQCCFLLWSGFDVQVGEPLAAVFEPVWMIASPEKYPFFCLFAYMIHRSGFRGFNTALPPFGLTHPICSYITPSFGPSPVLTQLKLPQNSAILRYRHKSHDENYGFGRWSESELRRPSVLYACMHGTVAWPVKGCCC